MIVIFRAEKMIARAKREGKQELLDDKTVAMIRELDGSEANTYNWRSEVYGEPLALIAGNARHPDMYVNIADCD